VAYREFAPPPPVRGVVECGWLAALDDGEAPHVQSVLPDGCMDLIWNGTEVLVAGPDTAAHPAARGHGEQVVGLRFAPGTLAGLLGLPAAALRDRRVPLAELRPGLARAAPRGAPGAFLVETALALPGRTDHAAGQLAARIRAGAGVAATADAMGWTTRTLHRRCLDAFGYGPAVLRRVLRFRRAADLLCAGVAPAEVAAVAGYADQPHLSREVRALAGVSPRQLASGANRSTPLPSGSRTVA
jgi:AraC-like DNA-binding protein